MNEEVIISVQLTQTALSRAVQITPDPKPAFRELCEQVDGAKTLKGYDLFNLFTADIIREDVTFIR